MSFISDPVSLYGVIFILLIAGMFLYFRIADRFNIIDRPGERRSHSIPTVRGGGAVFALGLLLWFLFFDFQYPWFLMGSLLIAVVSFLDDLGEQPARVRFAIHVIAFGFIMWQAGVAGYPVWQLLLIAIVGIGALNAFNFMDGINGITGVYALVNLLSFYVINKKMVPFTDQDLIIVVSMAVCVFLFFNFRKKARCFAGDVGSVTLAFVQVFLLLQLIRATGNYGWVLLFLVYGIDSVVTIVYRLRNGENIFRAHRSHLYQYLANELRIPHLWVSSFYGIVQLGINLLLLKYISLYAWWFPVVVLAGVGVVYVAIRERVLRLQGRRGLIG